MVEHLGPDSALARAQAGHTWTHDRDWLLAEIADAVRYLVTVTLNVHRDRNTPAVPMPERVPRPDTGDDESDDEATQAVRAEFDETRKRIFAQSAGR